MNVRTLLQKYSQYPIEICMCIGVLVIIYALLGIFDVPVGGFTNFQIVQVCVYITFLLILTILMVTAARIRVTLQEIADRDRKGGL